MRRIIAISFALLTLALSLKADLAFHFCGGKLVQLKFIVGNGKATCGMGENKDNCKNGSSSFKNTSCCANQIQRITTDNYESTDILKLLSFEYTSAIVQTEYVPFEQAIEVKSLICYRPPPSLTAVSLPFIKVFLI